MIPVVIFMQLIEIHKRGGVSFENVVTFKYVLDGVGMFGVRL